VHVNTIGKRQEVGRRKDRVLGIESVAMLTADAVVVFQVIDLIGIHARRGRCGGAQSVAGLQENGPANLQVRGINPLSAGHYLPCTIAAGDSGQWNVKPGHASANPEVEMVDRHTEHAHEDLPRTGLGTWNVYNLKDARVPVFCNVNGLHGSEVY
jgi:hypothetical protein